EIAYRSGRRAARNAGRSLATLLLKSGNIAEHRGRYPDALRTFRRGMRTAAADERIRLELAYANVRMRQGRFREAIKWCDRAVAGASGTEHRRELANAYFLLHY